MSSVFTFSSDEESGCEDADWEQVLTLSNLELEKFPEDAFSPDGTATGHSVYNWATVNIIVASKNCIQEVPNAISLCTALKRLDFSKNKLKQIPLSLITLPKLKVLDLGSNELGECFVTGYNDDVFPTPGIKSNINHLVLSNNNITVFPNWIFELDKLTYLHLGANKLKGLPSNLCSLTKLTDFYLGGNKISEIPETIGCMLSLRKLILNDNQIESIPDTLAYLTNLKSLMLHGNRLKVLPQSLVKLENLEELSLRGNPLVDRFVRTMHGHKVQTLKEIASRFIVNNRVPFKPNEVPNTLKQFLKSSQRCVNPECSGVYFTSRVEHVKFVDFCGRYRVPLLIYLCSPNCEYPEAESSSGSDSEASLAVSPMQMQRVLLG